jgi:serine/threonine protein kinase
MLENSLFLVYFVLAICFTSIFLYTGLRSLSLKLFVASWKNVRFLYYFQLTELFFRTCSFWCICLMSNLNDLENLDIAFIMLSLPESLIISCYIALFWIMLKANFLTRFDSSSNSSASGFLRTNKRSLLLIQSLTKYFLIAWVALDLFLYILLFCGLLSELDIIIQHSALCFFISLIVLISIGIVQFKYSGIPYISNDAQLIMKKVLIVVFVWSIGRIVHGILYLIREKDLITESKDLSGITVSNPVPTIILIFDLLITEILCFMFVVDYSFFRIFLKEIDDFPKVPLLDRVGEEDYERPVMNLEATEAEIVVEKEIPSGLHKLGKCYIGKYLNRPATIRRLHLPRVNNYIIEKLHEDLNMLSTIFCPHYAPPLALSIRNETIDIVYPCFPKGSLRDLLNNSFLSSSYIKLLKIGREIAFCMKIFHDFGKVHGHLTSYNVLLDPEDTVFISDLGLDHLKKYCSITADYRNKSAWTSPQQLSEGGTIASKSCKSDDVYSFGVILWEILTGEEPFRSISLKQIRQTVNEGYRPSIPDTINSDLAELMKSCWNTDPSHRPSFELVHNTMCLVIAREQGYDSFYSALGN